MAAKRGRKKKEEKTPTTYLQKVWANQAQLSFILGAIVVAVVFLLLAKYQNSPEQDLQPNPTQIPAIETEAPNAIQTPQPILSTAAPQESLTPQAITTPQASQRAVSTPTPAPTAQAQQPRQSTYTIKPGDTLWKIAQETYATGYAYQEIAKANNITNTNVIHVGNTLRLPNVDTAKYPKTVAGVITEKAASTSIMNSYTVQRGDSLWEIAEKAYGTGYGWQKIAQANKIANPNIIHVGNTLTIPQGP